MNEAESFLKDRFKTTRFVGFGFLGLLLIDIGCFFLMLHGNMAVSSFVSIIFAHVSSIAFCYFILSRQFNRNTLWHIYKGTPVMVPYTDDDTINWLEANYVNLEDYYRVSLTHNHATYIFQNPDDAIVIKLMAAK